MKIRILLILFAGISLARAQPSENAVLVRLAKVDRFAFGGVGYAGVMSRGEKNYRIILARTSAEADFENLLSIGNPQAQLYALAGIRLLDEKRFHKLSQTLHDSKIDVTVQRGCIVDHETFSVILKRIEAGDYVVYSGH